MYVGRHVDRYIKKLINNMAVSCILDNKATEKRNKLSLYSIVRFKHFLTHEK